MPENERDHVLRAALTVLVPRLHSLEDISHALLVIIGEEFEVLASEFQDVLLDQSEHAMAGPAEAESCLIQG